MREDMGLLGIPSVRTIISSGDMSEWPLPEEMAVSILSKCSSNTIFKVCPVGVPSDIPDAMSIIKKRLVRQDALLGVTVLNIDSSFANPFRVWVRCVHLQM